MRGRSMRVSLVYVLLSAGLYARVCSLSSPAGSVCALNFSAFPYRPVGGCPQVQERIEDWNGLPRSSCCQNVLLVFAHALALQALAIPSSSVFIGRDAWDECSRPFTLQPNLSVHNCGFESLYTGNGRCLTLQLSTIGNFVVQECSLLGSSSFDYACDSCTSAISKRRNELLDYLKVDKNDRVEKAICLFALIVSVIAGQINGSFVSDDFNRCLPALAEPERMDCIKTNYNLAETILAMMLGIIGLSAVVVLIIYVIKKRKRERQPLRSGGLTASCSALYRFSKAEISSAINYGPEKKYLGRGSAGRVYMGMLPSGQHVAIKQLYKINTSDSFTREIEGLSRVRHKNLVCLLGCCFEDEEQYLVYEYCSNGNLAQHLLNKDSVLTWEARVEILRDCAFALKYLHHHAGGCIVHRDIKPTNILLTHKMEPKLSDFGLARIIGREESKVFTDVRGTIGYMDPEYLSIAKLTCASDIYSFGIVMLQLLSGQRVIELDLDARDQLIRKAKDVNMMRRPLTDFQDPRLKGDIVTVDFESILQIAVLCVASSSTGRPTIQLVSEELDKVQQNTQTVMAERKNASARPSKSPELLYV